MTTIDDIELRVATAGDLQALIEVGDQLFDHPIKEDRAQEFFDDPRHHLILGFHRDRIVGMASTFHYVHPDKDPAMFINEVSVLKEYQNLKIGRSLVGFCCKVARKMGCTEAWIATEETNVSAIRTYLAAGGEKDPENIRLFVFPLDRS